VWVVRTLIPSTHRVAASAAAEDDMQRVAPECNPLARELSTLKIDVAVPDYTLVRQGLSVDALTHRVALRLGGYVGMAEKSREQLTDLGSYASPFITVRQLSEYWNISRRQVLRLIETGRLESVRLGPKTLRIPVHAALAFERRHGSHDGSGGNR